MYSIVLISTSSILVLLYAWLRVWLNKRPNVDFAKRLTTCMMIFNIFVLARYGIGRIISYQYCEGTEGCGCSELKNGCEISGWYKVGGVLWALTIIIYLLSFNLGQWYFSFYYYKCSSEMECVIKSSSNHEVEKCLELKRKYN
jgi:hypothetical protein